MSCHFSTNTVELGYNITKGTEYSVWYNECCEEFTVMIIIIIIIIIICHELGLDLTVSASSNAFFKVFSVVFDYFVQNSALTCHSNAVHSCHMSQLILVAVSQFLLNWSYFRLFQNFLIPFVVRIRGGMGSSDKFNLE